METYTILKDIGANTFQCLDRAQMTIKTLRYGHFIDITKKCARMANSKTKADCLGATWHNSLTKGESIHYSDILLETNDKAEYFAKLIELQTKQAEGFAYVLKNHNKWSEPFAMGYNDTKF